MKKKLKMFGVTLMLMFAGILSVCAASQTLYSNSSYFILPAQTKVITNKSATYSTAKANMEIEEVTAGTRKTKFIANRTVGGTTVQSANVIVTLAPYTCYLATIGTIGSGTWTLTNQSSDTYQGTFSGWRGVLEYLSVS